MKRTTPDLESRISDVETALLVLWNSLPIAHRRILATNASAPYLRYVPDPTKPQEPEPNQRTFTVYTNAWVEGHCGNAFGGFVLKDGLLEIAREERFNISELATYHEASYLTLWQAMLTLSLPEFFDGDAHVILKTTNSLLAEQLAGDKFTNNGRLLKLHNTLMLHLNRFHSWSVKRICPADYWTATNTPSGLSPAAGTANPR